MPEEMLGGDARGHLVGAPEPPLAVVAKAEGESVGELGGVGRPEGSGIGHAKNRGRTEVSESREVLRHRCSGYRALVALPAVSERQRTLEEDQVLIGVRQEIAIHLVRRHVESGRGRVEEAPHREQIPEAATGQQFERRAAAERRRAVRAA